MQLFHLPSEGGLGGSAAPGITVEYLNTKTKT